MKRPQVEILAPASGLEAIRAAIFAGADAVYTGGAKFGARAYADNLVEDELLQAIDFVHLHGKQIYLTVNTLLKEKELEEDLVAYLTPYYERGLDAVIVQDIGVFQTVKEHFPNLPIHVSTQAVITGEHSAVFWEKLGAERIVTARELSLEEIKTIRKHISIEIESFVHGALCFCYSGQCLFSSFLGGRSGNRGRCAQPCRLPYQLLDENGNKYKNSTDGYLLSPKDMCTLDILPDIIEAGVFSLKIEGRMKRPEYTAGVTAVYRKYVDLYFRIKEEVTRAGTQGDLLQKIKEQYHVSRQDRERLMDLYNRGNFHNGYYKQHNGVEMMSMERPNHNGVYVGTMKKGKQGFSMKVQQPLHRQDMIEFRGVEDRQRKSDHLELAVEKDVAYGAEYVLPAKYQFLLGKRQSVEVYRTRNEALLKEIQKDYLEQEKQQNIQGWCSICEGEPMSLTVSSHEQTVTVEGDVVQSAQNQPVFEEYIRKQVGKTGNTPFAFESLEVYVAGNCFVSAKSLNQLRRDALDQLQQAIVSQYRRTLKPRNLHKEAENCREKQDGITWNVSVENLRQLDVVLSYEQIDSIYVSMHGFANEEELIRAGQKIHERGKKFYLMTPHIWRNAVERRLLQSIDTILEVVDGIVAKTTEAYTYFLPYSDRTKLVTDYTVYSMNSRAAQAWKEQGAHKMTLPVELNRGELTALAQQSPLSCELVVYGHLPMMVSAQCPVKNALGCQKKPMVTRLRDRKGCQHYVKNYCDICCSVIYNSEPLYLLDLEREWERMQVDSVRLQFTVESEEKIRQILEKGLPEGEYTRGHWKRGVE